ncbi:MAG: hypothetical protein ABSE73_22230 [Planctomycetota bacterium]
MSLLPLPALYKACPSAATVLLFLVETAMQTGRSTLTTSRTSICRATGIRSADTVTLALQALRAQKLIKYSAPAMTKPDGTSCGRYLKISLLKTRLDTFSALVPSLWKTRLSTPSVKSLPGGKPGSTGLPLSKDKAAVAPPLEEGGASALDNNSSNKKTPPAQVNEMAVFEAEVKAGIRTCDDSELQALQEKLKVELSAKREVEARVNKEAPANA